MMRTGTLGPVIGVLAAWIVAFSDARAADGADCKFVKIGELQVKFEQNEPLVQLGINGKPAWFLIDTGAASSLVWGGAARALGLGVNSTGRKFYGVGGSQDVNRTVISELSVAGQKIRDVPLYVIGHGGSEKSTGVIGRDILQYYNVEFDLASQTVRLWQALNCGDRSLAYWSKTPLLAELKQDGADGEYEIGVRINGRPVKAILDSGATTSVITQDAALSVGVKDESYAPGVGHSHGIGEKAVEVRLAAFDSVNVGDEQVKHTRLEVSDLFKDDTYTVTGSILPHRLEDTTSMLLGADFLRAHRVLLSPKQNLMYFTYNGGAVFGVMSEPARAGDGSPPSVK